ncbi:MAG: GDYXXLXY domain-containing protein [Pseudomonadota bacterium]
MSKFKLGLAAAFGIQILILGAMLFERVNIIQNGQEVILQSQFVDPRDVFRGHYVRLNLVAGTIGEGLPGASERYNYNQPVYVSLKETENGFWVAKAVHKTFPQDIEDPVLQGIYNGKRGNTLRVRFPFDRYFAPKERALELENIRDQQKLGVVLALNGSGGGVIKGITIDGEVIYDEPLL